MIPCPNWPKPVNDRNIQISNEISVGYTEPELLLHGTSHAVRDVGSYLKQLAVAWALLHGRSAGDEIDTTFGSLNDDPVGYIGHLLFKTLEIRRVHESKVHLGVGELRYGVGADPTIYFSDIDGNAFVKIIERLEFDNLVRHLKDGTGFILGCKGGMACSSFYMEFNGEVPLPAGNNLVVQTARFQDKGECTGIGFFLYQINGTSGTDFLI